MNDTSRFEDQDGLPGTIGDDGKFDGGDTAAILGTLRFFQNRTYPSLIWDYRTDVPLRHPDGSRWYGQPDRFSRDQMISILCGMLGSFSIFQHKLYRAHKRRWFLTAWNIRKNGVMDTPKKFPDITGPTVWALWLRLRGPRWAPLVLWLLDLEMLLSALHWRYLRKDRVTRNHMLVSLASVKYSPTWVSRLVDRINRWPDLIERWRLHCEIVGEYPTAYLFKQERGHR